ncbi:MAG: hypothetical protein RLZZ69_2191, partial [Cyanobacteriota bacterium]
MSKDAKKPQTVGELISSTYFDDAHAMVDVVYESQLRRQDWSDEKIPADENGAPTQDFLMIFNATKRFASGTYRLQFRGRADVGTSVGSLQNQTYNPVSNLTTADLVLPEVVSGNAWLVFNNTRRTAASTSADGVAEVHLWRPGYARDGSEVFTREFIAAMQKFHLIRGMDFVSANSNSSVHWSDRTTMNWIGEPEVKGAPWELLVLLANATGNDIWLNVPVRADDDYLLKLAQLLRYGSDGVNPYTSAQANPVYP